MSVYKQIKGDTVSAMKDGNTEKRDLLRVVTGEFDRIGNKISDIKAISIIRKMYSNAIDFKNDIEANILESYLPKMLEPKEIKVIVANIIEVNKFSGIQDLGKVIGKLKQSKEISLIDMKTASTLIKELL